MNLKLFTSPKAVKAASVGSALLSAALMTALVYGICQLFPSSCVETELTPPFPYKLEACKTLHSFHANLWLDQHLVVRLNRTQFGELIRHGIQKGDENFTETETNPS